MELLKIKIYMENKLMYEIGEALIGNGPELAHIDLIMVIKMVQLGMLLLIIWPVCP